MLDLWCLGETSTQYSLLPSAFSGAINLKLREADKALRLLILCAANRVNRS